MKSKSYSVNWTTEKNYVFIVLQLQLTNLETLTVLVVRSIQVKTFDVRKMQIGIEIIRRLVMFNKHFKITTLSLLFPSEHNTQV